MNKTEGKAQCVCYAVNAGKEHQGKSCGMMKVKTDIRAGFLFKDIRDFLMWFKKRKKCNGTVIAGIRG